MSILEDTFGVFCCQFCGRQETSTPRILAESGWDVVPYKNYNLCPNCEVRDWIERTTGKPEETALEKSQRDKMKDYDWHRPTGRNPK